MKFPPLIPAVFIQRNNRFTAAVRLKNGCISTAHIPTTGRLTGALRPGCDTWLQAVANPQRKTPFNLVLTELEHGGVCSINALLANRLFEEALREGRLSGFPRQQIEREVSLKHSRMDFRLSTGETNCWVEVKSVTYACDQIGLFPDAPTSRGRRHLLELQHLCKQGDRSSVAFIVQREDVKRFAPYEAIDPDFAVALRDAHQAGVEIFAYRCDVSTKCISIAEELPVLMFEP